MPIVNVKRPIGLINFPENVAVLQRITDNGFYEYQIEYHADPVKCVQEKANVVSISVSTKPYVRQIVPVFSTPITDVAQFTNNLLTKSSKQKDAIRSQKQDYLLTLISNISSRLSNDLYRKLALAPVGSSVSVKTAREVATVPVSNLTTSGLNAPVLEMNLAGLRANQSNDSISVSTNRDFQRASSALIQQRLDPASVAGAKTNSIVPAKKVTAGAINPKPAMNQRVAQQSKAAQVLIKGTTNQNKVTGQNELDQTDLIPVAIQKNTAHVRIVEKVQIPIAALNVSEFYLVFEVRGKTGQILDIQSVMVDHAKKVGQLGIVTTPPKVTGGIQTGSGKVCFDIKQLDPNGFGIAVYRRSLKPGESFVDATYTLADKFELKESDGFHRFEDRVASLSPVIYRFIPYNRDETNSAEFTSVVVDFKKPGLYRARERRKPHAVSFNALVKNSSIDIQITNVPVEPISIKLMRKDKTNNEREWTQILDDVLLDGFGNGSIYLEDTDVKVSHIYEYTCALLYKDGDVEFSSNTILISFDRVESNIMSIDIVNPRIIQLGSGFDVVFDIEYSLIKNGPEQVRDYLRSQGFYGEFFQEILADKNLLSQVFGFTVTRTNITTSEIETCGVLNSTNFSDARDGAPHGVSSLREGYEYRYTVNAYLRNPETLLLSATRNVPVRQDSTTTYVLKPSKWRHPVTLNEGNLASASALARNHAESPFTFGKIVDTKSVTLSLNRSLPAIESASASKAKEGSIFVQWRVQGNVNLIDHFLVGMDILGMQQNIGKCHNVSSTGYFQFMDDLTNGESGALTYIITPVYFDYAKGPATKTNQVVI